MSTDTTYCPVCKQNCNKYQVLTENEIFHKCIHCDTVLVVTQRK